MSRKSERISWAIDKFKGQRLDAHYLGYFECFNQQLFYEAHDVLEELWLRHREAPDGLFYKGLIQLAGAFVHLQKDRLRPAASLFKLAEANLRRYPTKHHCLEVTDVLEMIEKWVQELESGDFTLNPLVAGSLPPPKLRLAPITAQ